MSRRIAQWGAIGVLLLAGYIMLVDWINLRAVGDELEPRALEELPLPQPWGGYAWRALSRSAGDRWQAGPEQARATLAEASRRYPLDAPQWLDQARIEAASNDSASSVDPLLAAAAAVQPQARAMQWRATQIALQSDQPDIAERQLRNWIRDFPRDTERALFIAGRWLDEPDALVDRILPTVDGVIPDEFLVQTLRAARRQRDAALAEAAWQRFDATPGLADPALLEYVELLLDANEVDRAIALWQAADPAFAATGIANAGFDREPGEGLALNWRTQRPPAGVRIERDFDNYTSAPASLRIAFGGKDNIALNEPWTRIPVAPGTRYRLTGQWQARAITTRSRPYLIVLGEGARINARLELPHTRFDWQPLELEFDVPEDVRIVRLQLRRNRTEDFDRYIDGTLWLDDFALTPSPPEIEAGLDVDANGDSNRLTDPAQDAAGDEILPVSGAEAFGDDLDDLRDPPSFALPPIAARNDAEAVTEPDDPSKPRDG